MVQVAMPRPRRTRKNAIMASQVEKLSRQDLQDLAAYFASQSGSLTTKR